MGYYLQCEHIFSVLPYEITEEDNEEVVVCSDEAAEEAYELSRKLGTTMANMVISSRWSVIASTPFESILIIIWMIIL